MNAARDVLKGVASGPREAAARHEVNFPSHVHYCLKQWRGTLMEDVAKKMESTAVPREPATATSLAPQAELEGAKLLANKDLYKRMINEGVNLVGMGLSLRKAAANVNEKYSALERNVSISHGSIRNFTNPDYQPDCKAYLSRGARPFVELRILALPSSLVDAPRRGRGVVMESTEWEDRVDELLL
mmetsp:Transcript_12589/g.26691  ORF Transcript_12589/g.26691 Transcript_12589/m.26691 type:complete len:186 (+) Transcript_12589:428-985(+)